MVQEKILCVDDEVGIREAMDEFLKGEGYAVDLAENGSKALEMFGKTEYDLIFMDIRMPGIDGIETLREMKKAKPKCKVVIVSGVPDEEAFERAASIVDGTIEGFIAKPFKPSDIRGCLDKVLVQKEKMASFGLTTSQESALTKIGTAGAENASQSMAQVLGKEIQVGLGQVRSYSLKKLFEFEQKDEATILGAVMHVSGDLNGRIVTVFSWEGGLKLIELRTGLLNKEYSEAGLNTVKSAVLVLSKSYLSAVSKLLNVTVSSSLPAVFFDNEKAILKLVAKEFTDEHIFAIDTEVSVANTAIKSRVMLLPDTESLKMIFKNMSVL